MIRIRTKQFPKGPYKKLHFKNASPLKVLIKLAPILPEHMGISNIFNIKALILCSKPEDVSTNRDTNAHLPPAPHLKEEN